MTRGDQGLHRYIVISCPTSCKSTPRSSGFRLDTVSLFIHERRADVNFGKPENQKSRRKKNHSQTQTVVKRVILYFCIIWTRWCIEKKKKRKKTVGRSVRPLETCDLWFLPSSLCAMKMPWPGQKHVSWQKQAISLPVGIIREPKAYRDVQQSTIVTSHVTFRLFLRNLKAKGTGFKEKKKKKSELVIFFSSRHTRLFVFSP